MPDLSDRYWFKPKRFWGWFAAYYPVSAWGWFTAIFFGVVLVLVFAAVDRRSHSVSDTFFAFAPLAVVILILADLVTRLKGEYPAWWKKNK